MVGGGFAADCSVSVRIGSARCLENLAALACTEDHRSCPLRPTDALIAATAIEHGLPVVTQDDDYSRIAQAHSALQVMMV